jgi:hypothetical protein
MKNLATAFGLVFLCALTVLVQAQEPAPAPSTRQAETVDVKTAAVQSPSPCMRGGRGCQHRKTAMP